MKSEKKAPFWKRVIHGLEITEVGRIMKKERSETGNRRVRKEVEREKLVIGNCGVRQDSQRKKTYFSKLRRKAGYRKRDIQNFPITEVRRIL